MLSAEERLGQIVETAFDRASGNAEEVVKLVQEEVFQDVPLMQALFQDKLRNTVLAMLPAMRGRRKNAGNAAGGKVAEVAETPHSVDCSIAQTFLLARGVNVIDVIEAGTKPTAEPSRAKARAAGAGKK
jgi:hypothetical protein